MIVTSALLTAILSGCGGSSSDNTSEQSPTFSLAVSDAPVDDLSAVVMCFNQIELKGNGDDTVFTVGNETGMIAANDLCLDENDAVIPDTVGIDLKQYTGSESINLVNGINIPAGEYTQLRLKMSEGSYGIDAESEDEISVSVPSNELKLDGFTATLGGTVNFTLEFDLNKAMTNPVGQTGYFLKPRGVRLVNNNQAGHITGIVSETLLLENQCTPLADPETNAATVYLYQGTNLALDSLEDNGGSATGNLPYASAAVIFNSTQTSYDFEIGFVDVDSYTIAVTCTTADDPEIDEDIGFISSANVTVEASNTPSQVNL